MRDTQQSAYKPSTVEMISVFLLSTFLGSLLELRFFPFQFLAFLNKFISIYHNLFFFFFLILILVFVLRILVRALWHFHYQKRTLVKSVFRIVLFVLFLLFLEVLWLKTGGSLQEFIVAHCDPRDTQSNESLAAEVRAAALPEEAEVLAAALPDAPEGAPTSPDSPEEAPTSPEVEIEVETYFTPRFPTELPLMEDATRMEELHERFRFNTLGAP